jgi:hypothetical protein
MIHDEATGERIFRVPFDETIPGGPFHGRAELLLVTVGDHPRQLALRFFPTEYEFQVKLQKLIAEGGFDVYPPELSRAAAEAQPIVTYEAEDALLRAVPDGLVDLEALQRYFETRPALFDLGRYKLAGIAFEDA